MKKRFYFLRKLRDILIAPLHHLLRTHGFHFVIITNQARIGHLVSETDWFVRKMLSGSLPEKQPIILVNKNKVANKAYLEILRQRYFVVTNPILRAILRPISKNESMSTSTFEAVSTINRTANYYETFAMTQHLQPIWQLPDQFQTRGEQDLESLGVPKGSWFVCVHAREGGYSPCDEYAHDYRNSDIESCNKAIDEIIERGGWCIRIGDPSMKQIKPRKKFIDYAHSSFKSDWMDLFLMANCRFVLGNTSGICIVSSIFDIPSVLVNMAPMSCSYGIHPEDISIPKLIQTEENELITFAEIMNSDVCNFRFSKQYKDGDLTLVDNTDEEIKSAVSEMMDKMFSGKKVSCEDKERQKQFKSLFDDRHYCAMSEAKISEFFLRKNKPLL